jgi:hypothetical protein
VRAHHTPIPLRSTPKTFEDHLKSWYSIAGILFALAASGWFARGWIGGLFAQKADAAALAAVDTRSSTDHEQLVQVKTRVDAMADELHEMRVEVHEIHAELRSRPPAPAATKGPP